MAKRKIATITGIEYAARTGALRIGSDWPGVFLRGDEVMHWWQSLDLAARELTKLCKQAGAKPEACALGRAAQELRELNRLLKSAVVFDEEHDRIAREHDFAVARRS
jgi:hypothetical protein